MQQKVLSAVLLLRPCDAASDAVGNGLATWESTGVQFGPNINRQLKGV